MSKSKYLYGFKHIVTDNFKDSYRTIRGKVKTACFRSKGNAEKALEMQSFKKEFYVYRMCAIHT